jgi:hypothetical protein
MNQDWAAGRPTIKLSDFRHLQIQPKLTSSPPLHCIRHDKDHPFNDSLYQKRF